MNEMASSLNVYSFWDLLNEFKIVIPIIQRDYAQGRNSKKVKPIRDDLLETIYSALIDEKKLDFDFVYGSVKDKILYPLDGQQRLTTLFLLHWYIAAKEGKLNDVRASLHNFTYETRISTREFCKRLVESASERITSESLYPINSSPMLRLSAESSNIVPSDATGTISVKSSKRPT